MEDSKMSLFEKSQKLTANTIGTIIGVSAVCVNKMHLPLAEYEVNGKKYKVRVPYDIAIKMERQSENSSNFVRSNVNFGTNVVSQITKLQGCKAKILYDPKKPQKAEVIE